MPDPKILAAGAVVIALAAVFFGANSAMTLQKEKALRVQKEQELTAKMEEMGQLQAELKQLKKQKADAETKYEAAMATHDAEIDEYKKNAKDLADKIDVMTKEKTELQAALDEKKTQFEQLNKKISKLEEEKALLITESSKAAAEAPQAAATGKAVSDVQELPAQSTVVDLGSIILHRSSNLPARVEHVDTLWGFVVVSAGTRDNLKANMVLNISRNNRFIAKAVVKKVREDIASAVMLPEWTREDVKTGDLISVSR